MIAASRFEGGSWVRVGFLVTYAAFAYGCIVVAMAATRLPSFWRPDVRNTGPGDARIRWASAIAAVLAIALLALPAIEFPSETLSGFRGLDALSVIIAVGLALVVVAAAGGQHLANLQLPAAICLAGVLAGNLVIQRFTTRGTTVEYGLWWAAGIALVAVVAAALGVRGRPEDPR